MAFGVEHAVLFPKYLWKLPRVREDRLLNFEAVGQGLRPRSPRQSEGGDRKAIKLRKPAQEMDSPDDSRQDDGMGPCPSGRAVRQIRRSVFDLVHLLIEGRHRDKGSRVGAALCARMCQLPSEALPIQCGLGGEGAACLLQEGNKITLVLRRR